MVSLIVCLFFIEILRPKGDFCGVMDQLTLRQRIKMTNCWGRVWQIDNYVIWFGWVVSL